MYTENIDLANDYAKSHIEDLIAEADVERRANAYLAGQTVQADNTKTGVVTWLMDLVKPSTRITTKRV